MAQKIYRSNSLNGTYTHIADSDTTAISLPNQPDGTNYYKVSATNISGESPLSNAITQVVVSNPVAITTTNRLGNVLIKHPLPAHSSGIELDASPNASMTPSTRVYTGSNSETVLTNMNSGTFFRYRGVSTNATSAYCPVYSYVSPALSAVSVTALQQGTNVKVSWTADPNALGYDIFFNGSHYTSVAPSTREYTFENVTVGATFMIRSRSGITHRDSTVFSYSPIVPIPVPSISAVKEGVNIRLNWVKPSHYTPTNYILHIVKDGVYPYEEIAIAGNATSYLYTASKGAGNYQFWLYNNYQGWGASAAITSLQLTLEVTISVNYNSTSSTFAFPNILIGTYLNVRIQTTGQIIAYADADDTYISVIFTGYGSYFRGIYKLSTDFNGNIDFILPMYRMTGKNNMNKLTDKNLKIVIADASSDVAIDIINITSPIKLSIVDTPINQNMYIKSSALPDTSVLVSQEGTTITVLDGVFNDLYDINTTITYLLNATHDRILGLPSREYPQQALVRVIGEYDEYEDITDIYSVTDTTNNTTKQNITLSGSIPLKYIAKNYPMIASITSTYQYIGKYRTAVGNITITGIKLRPNLQIDGTFQ